MTGQADLGKQAAEQMCDAFAQMPGLPEGFLDRFKQAIDPEEFIALLRPIYCRHLEEKTVEAMIAFAESAEGKKYFAAQPAIMKESMAAGQQWGRDLAGKVLRELRK